MKKVKFYSVINIADDDDGFQSGLGKAIVDWTEISDEEYSYLQERRYLIEGKLREEGILKGRESLGVIREFGVDEEAGIKLGIKEIIQTVRKEEQARAEKEKKRRESLEKAAQNRRREKELKLLKKLQEKWGEKEGR